jgi:hypothetical protein
MTLDFASAFPDQPEEALTRLEGLVRHRDSCLGRIALLRNARGPGDQPLAGNAPSPADEFAAEIALLAEGRALDAYFDGTLLPDQIDRLHRLTCSADGLWIAHCRYQQALATAVPEPTSKPVAESAPGKA